MHQTIKLFPFDTVCLIGQNWPPIIIYLSLSINSLLQDLDHDGETSSISASPEDVDSMIAAYVRLYRIVPYL